MNIVDGDGDGDGNTNVCMNCRWWGGGSESKRGNCRNTRIVSKYRDHPSLLIKEQSFVTDAHFGCILFEKEREGGRHERVFYVGSGSGAGRREEWSRWKK